MERSRTKPVKKGGEQMKKAVIAFLLVALVAVSSVSAAFANEGANGLSIACGSGQAGGHNPNCGF